VLEQARCVGILDRHPVDLGGYANARAAFEAAQDLVFLVTDENFDLSGARVRVFENLEFADTRAKYARAFPEDMSDASTNAIDSTIEGLVKMADGMREAYPDRARDLDVAIAESGPVFRKGTRLPSHWSLLSRRRMAELIADRLDDLPDAQRAIFTYSHLSRASHPRLRLELLRWETNPSGRRTLEDRTEVRETITGIAEVSIGYAQLGIDRLRAMYNGL
jgi:hypothetical protein